MKMVCQPRTKNQRRNQVQMKLDVSSLAHTKWECKYHIVFAPKYRRQVIYGKIKQDIGQMLRKLCEYKGITRRSMSILTRRRTSSRITTKTCPSTSRRGRSICSLWSICS